MTIEVDRGSGSFRSPESARHDWWVDHEQADSGSRRGRLQREERRARDHLRGAGSCARFGDPRKHATTSTCVSRSDRKTGEYKTFRRWKSLRMTRRSSSSRSANLRFDDAIDVDRSRNRRVRRGADGSVVFGRIAAQTAKQSSCRRLREADARKSSEYKDRVSSLVSGIVKRVDRHGVYVTRRQRGGLRAARAHDPARNGKTAGSPQGVAS